MSIVGVLEALVASEPWMDHAACASVGGDTWFPEKGESTRDAKKICQGCPVVQECLAYALRTDQRFGVWGSLSERERRKLKVKGTPRSPRTHCRRNHILAVVGKDAQGVCKECRRISATKYNQKIDAECRRRRANGAA